MSNARDELAEIIQDCGEYIPGSHADDYVSPDKAADAILAAGYRKPRTITTAEELDDLTYGTAVAHDEGWGYTVAQRQAEDLRWYVTGCLEYIRPEALLPAMVIHEPRYF